MNAGHDARGRRLLVMSVTKLADGVCVACLDTDYKWVRPTRENETGWRQLEVNDLFDERGQEVVRVGNVVTWSVGDAIPRDAHTEDVPESGRPRLARRAGAAELRTHCARCSEGSFAAFLRSADRSLLLLAPQSVDAVEFSDYPKRGLNARITFRCDGRCEDLSVTDLQWRACGRTLLGRHRSQHLRWTHEEFAAREHRRVEFLAIGRGQPFHESVHPLAGPYWPFVITVFTTPPVDAPIDFQNR